MKKIIAVLLLVLAVIAVACHTTSRCHVTSLDRSMIPYKTGDTVYCIDAKGNRVVLTVTDETSEWDHYDEYLWEEYRNVYLESEDGKYTLTLGVQGWNYGNYSQRRLSVCFDSPFGESCGEAKYDEKGHFKSWSGNSSDTYTQWDVMDSVSINNRTYYDVALYYHTQSNLTWHCCYNKTYGTLQMKLDEKPIFTLDTVIFAK